MSKLNSIMSAMGIKKTIHAKAVAQEVTKSVSKPVVKTEANAIDIMEAQGRAIVKKYQKPEINVVKMEKSSMNATSGNPELGEFLPSRKNSDMNAWGDVSGQKWE